MRKGTASLVAAFAVFAGAAVDATAGNGPVEGMTLVQSADARPLTVPLWGRPGSDSAVPRIALSAAKDLEEGATPKPDAVPLLVGRSRRESVLKLSEAERGIRMLDHVGGRIGHLSITSPGARALRVALRIDEVVPGMEIRVAGDAEAKAGTVSFRFPLRESGFVGQRAVEIWTPTTSGDTQLVEVSVPAGARAPTVTVENVSHLFVDPAETAPSSARGMEKVLSCHVNYTCVTDPVVVQVGESVARLGVTVATGETYVCSGALVNDRSSSGTPWFATAHHCKVTTQSVASNLQFWWKFEQNCTTGVVATPATSIGAQLLFTEAGPADFTLLRASGPLPSGLRSLGWDSREVANGETLGGVHHPAGAAKAVSVGEKTGSDTVTFRTGVSSSQTISGLTMRWRVGVTEGGSSGSPLFKSNGAFVGVLSAGPGDPTCATAVTSYYSKFSLAYPKVRQWLDPVTQTADDWPNSAAASLATQTAAYDNTVQAGSLETASDQDWFRFSFPEQGVWLLFSADTQGASTNTAGRIYGSDGATVLAANDDAPISAFGRHFLFLNRTAPGNYYLQVTGSGGATGPYMLNSIFAPDDDHSDFFFLGTALPLGTSVQGSISRAGDTDFFVFDVPSTMEVTIGTTGATDVVGFLYDANLRALDANDDVAYPSNLNFQIRRTLAAGRYYLEVLGYDVVTRGSYSVQIQATSTGTSANYTALWWNPAENGWGVNFTHQGNNVFGTLFTYDANRVPMWLVMSGGTMQADGVTFSGDLYRTTGPAFNAVPFTPITAANYTRVGTMSTTFSGANNGTLSYTVNGVAVIKSIERLVYGSRIANCVPTTASRASSTNYQDLWWNAAEGGWGVNVTHQDNTLFATLFTYDASGRDLWLVMSGGVRQSDGSYQGTLYRASGPAFNANPFTPITEANLTTVGTMRFQFADGEHGTLTYTVNGAQVTKAITRLVFSSPVPLCN